MSHNFMNIYRNIYFFLKISLLFSKRNCNFATEQQYCVHDFIFEFEFWGRIPQIR